MSSEVKGYKKQSGDETIDKLNLPCGLKWLLASHDFPIAQLLCMKSGDIADTLGIDQDAARLIVSAVIESRPSLCSSIENYPYRVINCQFAICKICFWSATIFKSRVQKCPLCLSSNISLISIANDIHKK